MINPHTEDAQSSLSFFRNITAVFSVFTLFFASARHKVLQQKIWFDVPYMRDPSWFNIQVADAEMLQVIQDNIDYMKEKVLSDEEYGKSFLGFKNYEVLKLERDLAWAKEGLNMSEEKLSTNLIRFYEYFTQYDKRRNLNFLATFPEMTDFWNEAKEEYKEQHG